jgi:hypothetical protein
MTNLESIKERFTSVTVNDKEVVKAVEAIIASGDIEAQNSVVQIFIAACQGYDSGHRNMDSGDLLDDFIDKLFPRFASESLAYLLEWASADMLMYDYMDTLFEPAFAGADDNVKVRLFYKLTNYYRTAFDYEPYDEASGEEYFKKLFEQYAKYLTAEQNAAITKLQNNNAEKLAQRIWKANTAELEELIKTLKTLSLNELKNIENVVAGVIEKNTEISVAAAYEYFDLALRNDLFKTGKDVLFFIENNYKDALVKTLETLPNDKDIQLSVCGAMQGAVRGIYLDPNEDKYSEEILQWLYEKVVESAKLCKGYRDDFTEIENIKWWAIFNLLKTGFSDTRRPRAERKFLLEKAYRLIDQYEKISFDFRNPSENIIDMDFQRHVNLFFHDNPLPEDALDERYELIAGLLYRMKKIEFTKKYMSAQFQLIMAEGLRLAIHKNDEKLKTNCIEIIDYESKRTNEAPNWYIQVQLAVIAAMEGNREAIYQYAKFAKENKNFGKNAREYFDGEDGHEVFESYKDILDEVFGATDNK